MCPANKQVNIKILTAANGIIYIKFVSPIQHLSHVFLIGREPGGRRNCHIRDQIYRSFVIPREIHAQTTKKTQFNTKIQRVGFLPLQMTVSHIGQLAANTRRVPTVKHQLVGMIRRIRWKSHFTSLPVISFDLSRVQPGNGF